MWNKGCSDWLPLFIILSWMHMTKMYFLLPSPSLPLFLFLLSPSLPPSLPLSNKIKNKPWRVLVLPTTTYVADCVSLRFVTWYHEEIQIFAPCSLYLVESCKNLKYNLEEFEPGVHTVSTRACGNYSWQAIIVLAPRVLYVIT